MTHGLSCLLSQLAFVVLDVKYMCCYIAGWASLCPRICGSFALASTAPWSNRSTSSRTTVVTTATFCTCGTTATTFTTAPAPTLTGWSLPATLVTAGSASGSGSRASSRASTPSPSLVDCQATLCGTWVAGESPTDRGTQANDNQRRPPAFTVWHVFQGV